MYMIYIYIYINVFISDSLSILKDTDVLPVDFRVTERWPAVRFRLLHKRVPPNKRRKQNVNSLHVEYAE